MKKTNAPTITIEKKYRPIPFWSWNDELDPETTARQVELMHGAGIGGFFMHARGGLLTPYMGHDWFANVDSAVAAAETLGMDAWAYDENGWPSGFGNGIVTGEGVKFQQKYLRIEKEEDPTVAKKTDRTVANTGGYHLYYDVNEFYVDTLCKEATEMFVDRIYSEYVRRYKDKEVFRGIFTDEPQISRDGIPWSFDLPGEYKKRHGEDIFGKLPLLFFPLEGYREFRVRFWKIVTDMFSANFMKVLYDYCESNGLMLTGHLVLEESLYCQLTSNGAAMPHYEYFHIPGMDWLCRPIFQCLTARQVSSVAEQLNKPQVLSETFALCGHNVSFEEMRGIYEWQMARGINLLCTHLEGYSIKGIRKRDYPPALFYQQPWWGEFGHFTDALSYIGKLLAEGEAKADTLLLHPQSSAWIHYDGGREGAGNKKIDALNGAFLGIITKLEQNHVQFHLGDETLMERHAKVVGGRLVIGKQSYGTIIVPPHELFMESTTDLIQEFIKQGGKIFGAGDEGWAMEKMEKNDIIDNPGITATVRELSEGTLYYFVNSTPARQKAKITVGTSMIDPSTGERRPFDRDYEFAPYTSLLVMDEKGAEYVKPEAKEKLPALDLSGEFELVSSSENALVLDRCSYSFDGVLVDSYAHTLDIQEKACALKRAVDIKLEYSFKADSIPDNISLLCETPEIFSITVNGKKYPRISKEDAKKLGWAYDETFKKLPLGGYIITGENSLVFEVKFEQSKEVYASLEHIMKFEGEKNKLYYTLEIEPVALVGDFTVKTPGTFTKLERGAVRYEGEFVVSAGLPKTLGLKNIEQQGFPFFSGRMTFAKKITLDGAGYRFAIEKTGINAVKVRANGQNCRTLIWNPFECELSDDLKLGENELEIEFVGNLRNLLGPHHLEEGESYVVHPGSFFRQASMWNGGRPPKWNDGYCFVEVGLK